MYKETEESDEESETETESESAIDDENQACGTSGIA
jgi:hypothetical protein